jgi:hypothetical protein
VTLGYSQAEKLSVIHLQKHTSDLTSQLGLLGLDLGVESLTQHLLLLRSGGGGEGLSGKTSSGSFLTTAGSGLSVLTATSLAGTHLTLNRDTTTTLSVARTTHTLAHGHARDLTTATGTTSELHLTHLGVAHAVRNATRAHSAHGDTLSEVGGNLLVGAHATSTLLTREGTGVLARAATGDTHHHTRLGSERKSTTLTTRDETLLAGAVEDSGLHVL